MTCLTVNYDGLVTVTLFQPSIASFKSKISGRKQKLFYYALRFHGSGTCSCHSGDGLSLSQLRAGIIWTFLHSCVWSLSWDDYKAEFSWDCQLEYVHMASPWVWVSCSAAVGLQDGESENAYSERARWTWCWKSQGLTSIALYRLKKSQVQFQWVGNIDSTSQRGDVKSWWPLFKNHNTYHAWAGDASKLFNNWHC